jgi:hypothetical protein
MSWSWVSLLSIEKSGSSRASDQWRKAMAAVTWASVLKSGSPLPWKGRRQPGNRHRVLSRTPRRGGPEYPEMHPKSEWPSPRAGQPQPRGRRLRPAATLSDLTLPGPLSLSAGFQTDSTASVWREPRLRPAGEKCSRLLLGEV